MPRSVSWPTWPYSATSKREPLGSRSGRRGSSQSTRRCLRRPRRFGTRCTAECARSVPARGTGWATFSTRRAPSRTAPRTPKSRGRRSSGRRRIDVSTSGLRRPWFCRIADIGRASPRLLSTLSCATHRPTASLHRVHEPARDARPAEITHSAISRNVERRSEIPQFADAQRLTEITTSAVRIRSSPLAARSSGILGHFNGNGSCGGAPPSALTGALRRAIRRAAGLSGSWSRCSCRRLRCRCRFPGRRRRSPAPSPW